MSSKFDHTWDVEINIYLLKYVIQNNNYVSFLTQILPL